MGIALKSDIYNKMKQKKQTVDETIKNLKNMGEHLVPMNFPRAPQGAEDSLYMLKHAEFDIDGYKIQVHYNKADYKNYTLLTFQVMGKIIPFLPFNIVFKLARKCLGEDHLSLLEIYRHKRKIYCWTLVLDAAGDPREYPYEEEEVEHLEYDGYEYTYMNANQARYY